MNTGDRMMMEKSIYLGDIDPNNNIDSAKSIRRQIMFQLLMWDSIILSDSQCLTDPRVHILMSGVDSSEICRDYSVKDVSESLKGFELLCKSGLVKIANRDGVNSNFTNLWYDMSKKDTKDVPYLPATSDYAMFLDGLDCIKRQYSLQSMGRRFRENLNVGVEAGKIILKKNDYVDDALRAMFLEKNVLFRNILDFIREMRNKGNITQERYDEIYRYVYGNYSGNISAETNCNISADFKNIPFHLELGGDDCCECVPPEELLSKMRPTWAFDPRILDYITFEEFVNIRKILKPVFENGRLIEFYKGNVLPENRAEVIAVWNEFTEKLEWLLKSALAKVDNVNMHMEVKNENPFMRVYNSSGVSLVLGALSFEPHCGAIIGGIGVAMDAFSILRYLKRRKTEKSLTEQKKFLEKYVNPDTKIITRFG